VNSHSTEVKPFQANPETLSTLFAIISVANWLVLPLAYIIWAATAIMLNHYSKIFGRKKYWIILSIPLISLIAGTISALLPSNYEFYFRPTSNFLYNDGLWWHSS
jgi:general stress protein CsbA